jgi:hypothetical protein
MNSRNDAEELRLLGQLVDTLEGQRTREGKIAGLRCFYRGIQGRPNEPEDIILVNADRKPESEAV